MKNIEKSTFFLKEKRLFGIIILKITVWLVIFSLLSITNSTQYLHPVVADDPFLFLRDSFELLGCLVSNSIKILN